MRVRSMLAAAGLAAVALAAVALALAAVPALAATSSSSTATTRIDARAADVPLLVAVRSAHHPGFDRITFEFKGPRPAHRIRYVSQLTEDGSGKPVHLTGGAAIEVVFHGANAHDASGKPTVSPRRFSPGLPSLKEVAQIGDFEAVVSYGLGVDHKVPFKVLELGNPSRIAVDVATSSSGTSGGSGASGGSAAPAQGTLPFTGSPSGRGLLEGLGLLAVGALVLMLARRTRTP